MKIFALERRIRYTETENMRNPYIREENCCGEPAICDSDIVRIGGAGCR